MVSADDHTSIDVRDCDGIYSIAPLQVKDNSKLLHLAEAENCRGPSLTRPLALRYKLVDRRGAISLQMVVT